MSGAAELTPAMRQYLRIKEQHKDCILFFRMGDFYEMFFEDAVLAAKLLEITLTSRNKGKEDAVPLCGVPYHAGGAYIAKLIDKGYKVAVCEQLEDPKSAKGVVKRDVVRIVTPGVVVDPENLEAKENNFLAALCRRGENLGLAFVDISTGEFRIAESAEREFLIEEIGGLAFREVLLEQGREGMLLKAFPAGEGKRRVASVPPDYFDADEAIAILRESFSAEALQRVGIEGRPAAAAAAAAGAVLRYVRETQRDRLRHLGDLQLYEPRAHLQVDETAKRNLEVFATIAEGRRQGSLFHVLDETVTPMGGRRLRWWLSYPLVVPARIRERQAAVGEIRERHLLRRDLRKALGGVYDLERLGARVAMGVANGRDLVALRDSLRKLPEIRGLLADSAVPLLAGLRDGVDGMPDVLDLVARSIVDDPPVQIREGGVIREGYDPALDELFAVSRDGKSWIARLEEKERQRTGIHSLRVGYNSVFGYYLEVTKANAEAVPADYVRKQTLVNAERYINEELKGYEYTVLHAEERRREKEYVLFLEIRERIAAEIRRLQRTAAAIAELDALASLAEVAERHGYCRPQVDEEDVIEIIDGRHPVVERMPPAEGFVPNDTLLDLQENRFLVITGPNMAGKSTYIRQVALIVLMAQTGSFVPAARARIGVVDRIFTRIGAADSLARGQSTFMVEMNETAAILRNATRRSLIVLDEVGRGTSTFDGLSIAWAVAEYLHDAPNLGARTLFATHYHQLTDLALTKEGVKNYNIAVKEWGDRIIFLRKIVEGGTNRSYGIQVARIAGVPDEVIARAREVLRNLEKGELDEIGMPRLARGRKAARPDSGQLPLFVDEEQAVVSELRDVDLNVLTPLEAMNLVGAWKERLGKKSEP